MLLPQSLQILWRERSGYTISLVPNPLCLRQHTFYDLPEISSFAWKFLLQIQTNVSIPASLSYIHLRIDRRTAYKRVSVNALRQTSKPRNRIRKTSNMPPKQQAGLMPASSTANARNTVSNLINAAKAPENRPVVTAVGLFVVSSS